VRYEGKLVMDARKRQLALALWNVGAVMDRGRSPESKGFRLKLHETNPDAPLSPIYLHLRVPENKGGPLTPEIVALAAKLMFAELTAARINFNALAGIPEAGNPFAEAMHRLCHSSVRLFELVKSQVGDQRQIVGIKGDVVSITGYSSPVFGKWSVLVDDLITAGHSKEEAIRVVENRGSAVVAIVVLVDREQGGLEELRKDGRRKVISVFTITELLDFYLAEGLMPLDICDEINAYLATA